MKEIINDIKTNSFKTVYLFFGEEQYLVRLYTEKLKDKTVGAAFAMLNMDTFEGKAAAPEQVENAAETLPVMSEKRLVLVRHSGLFTSGRKEDSEKIAKILGKLPETTVLLFVETDVDKRSRMYKETVKHGRAIEYKTPSEKELADWVVRELKKWGKCVTAADATALLRWAGRDMSALEVEIAKAAAYVGERETVTFADMEAACTKPLAARIFDMIDAIGYQNPEKALDIFNNLMFMKESPIMVIAMIARQLRLVLQSKTLAEKGISPGQIAQMTAQRSFTVDECLRQGRRFTREKIEQAVKDCLAADLSIKSGKMKDTLATEVLILKISSGSK